MPRKSKQPPKQPEPFPKPAEKGAIVSPLLKIVRGIMDQPNLPTVEVDVAPHSVATDEERKTKFKQSVASCVALGDVDVPKWVKFHNRTFPEAALTVAEVDDWLEDRAFQRWVSDGAFRRRTDLEASLAVMKITEEMWGLYHAETRIDVKARILSSIMVTNETQVHESRRHEREMQAIKVRMKAKSSDDTADAAKELREALAARKAK